MIAKKYTCIVCGRVFPEGQGIVIRRAGVELAFHSKACLAKFFKLFIEKLDEREFKRAAIATIKEFEELRKIKQKAKTI
jgi:large subunit ribosomal protein L24e